MTHARRRRDADEGGFSLVELVVIVIILGILAVISIATYLNQRQTAERASAISTLTNTRLAAESIRADRSEFPTEFEVYRDEQNAYEFVSGPSDDPEVVSFQVDDEGETVTFAVATRARCYYLRMQSTGALVRSTGELGGSGCEASDFPDDPTGEWT